MKIIFKKDFEEDKTEIRDSELGGCPCISLFHEGSYSPEEGSYSAKGLQLAKRKLASDLSPPCPFYGHLQVQVSVLAAAKAVA